MTRAGYDVASFRSLPKISADSLRAYVEERRPVGHFLRAVLSNDLAEAVARGDEENLEALVVYVRWLYNYAPADCWGSPKKVSAWLAHKEA